jgi:cytochrome P450
VLLIFSKLLDAKFRFRAFAQEYASKRAKSSSDRRDFYHYLLEAYDKETGERFTVPELGAQASVIIIGGSETTATAMASLFFYLAHNANALPKVTKEVREVFADVESINSRASLSSCHYLRACLDRAVRCAPPICGVLPRTVLPGGMVVDGLGIPAGVDVGVSAYVIGHNSAYFPDPFEYRPERWFISDSNPKEQLEMAKSAFSPFSYGPRSCIGMPLAYVEVRWIIPRFHHYVGAEIFRGLCKSSAPTLLKDTQNLILICRIDDVDCSQNTLPL